VNENGELTVNIGKKIITTVRYDYYVYRLLNMYLLTNYILTTVVLRLHDIRTRFLLLGFVIMLDKSIRRNKTCCRRKVSAVPFRVPTAACELRVRFDDYTSTRDVPFIPYCARPISQFFISPSNCSPLTTPALPAGIPLTTLSRI